MKEPMAVLVMYDKGKTYARALLKNGAVEQGVAHCVGGDTFKPEIGAVIAVCKALGVSVVDTCRAVLSAMASKTGDADKAAVKVKKRPVRMAIGRPLGVIKSGRVMLHLTDDLKKSCTRIKSLGEVGTPTAFKDRNNKPLHVGDLVTVDKLTGTVRQGRTWTAVPGLHFVVCEESDDPRSKGAYIMGLLDGCNAKTGKIDGRFRVRLAKTWKSVELGEVHDLVTPVWEGNYCE